jgi:hypothetical protein
MKRVFLIVVLVSGYVLSISLGYNQAEAAGVAYQREIAVQSVVPSNMPVKFSSTSYEVDGRGLPTLHFSVTNDADSRIKKIQLSVFAVNSKGHFIGVEGWREKIDLEAHATKEVTVILRNRVMLGDRVFLFVEQVHQASGVWATDPTKLLQVVKSSLEFDSAELPSSKFITRQPRMLDYDDYQVMGGDICDTRLSQARDACGSGGILAFSCNPETGAYSFTCR